MVNISSRSSRQRIFQAYPYDNASAEAAPSRRLKQFEAFSRRLDNELLNHPVILDNHYTAWFSMGSITHVQLQAFMIQFSVFSNQFLKAQLLKMLAANDIEEMRASKEILVNELGVAFNASQETASTHKNSDHENRQPLTGSEQRSFGDITGSVEGGRFHFRAAHFELLLHCAESIALSFHQLGKRQHGTKQTLFFCDELMRLYGSDDYQTSTAASFAVENWAASGFWQQLVDGLGLLKQKPQYKNLPLAFFSWHNKLEANHAHHTQQELRDYYLSHSVDEDAFIAAGNAMLNGVSEFWQGLDKQRIALIH